MSGAAGLSAAKRRRASSELNSKPNIKQLTSCEINKLNKEKEIASRTPCKVPYTEILHFHETRLNENDALIESMRDQQYILDDNMKMLLDANEQHFKQIDNDILRLKSKKTSLGESNNPNEDIAFYKEKISSLETQLLDLKTLVLKVQNFAMENNLPKQSTNNVIFTVKENQANDENIENI